MANLTLIQSQSYSYFVWRIKIVQQDKDILSRLKSELKGPYDKQRIAKAQKMFLI